MKLSDWAKKQGISYLTSYRWFKDGKLPVQAYQSDSGTIIVQDDSENLEQPMAGNTLQSNDVMSIFLKKTVEFSKNNSTIEDFAAFIISNFSLKLNGSSESSPKYSKNKPKTEDIQKHFSKFIPEKNSIDHLKMIKSLIKDNPNAPVDKVFKDFDLNYENVKVKPVGDLSETPIGEEDDLSVLYNDAVEHPSSSVVEGVVARNVEFVSTPQQTNYTGSTASTAFDNNIRLTDHRSLNSAFFNSVSDAGIIANMPTTNIIGADKITLNPTDTKLYSTTTILGASAALPKRRGRKPSKKSGIDQ